MRIKNLTLEKPEGLNCAIEALMTANVSRIPELAPEATIMYMGWLRKLSPQAQQSQFIVVLEFTSPEAANAAIIGSLVLEGEIYLCERLLRNHTVKKCYNCWAYGHIGSQWLARRRHKSVKQCYNCWAYGHIGSQWLARRRQKSYAIIAKRNHGNITVFSNDVQGLAVKILPHSLLEELSRLHVCVCRIQSAGFIEHGAFTTCHANRRCLDVPGHICPSTPLEIDKRTFGPILSVVLLNSFLTSIPLYIMLDTIDWSARTQTDSGLAQG